MADNSPSIGGISLSPNFGHLAAADPLLAQHGAKAERFLFEEPITALFKLRQFGEVLAQQAAAHTGMYTSSPRPPGHHGASTTCPSCSPRTGGPSFVS